MGVNTLDLAMLSYSLSASTASGEMKLQGWDGSAWVDLSEKKYATVTNATETFTNTLVPEGKFSKLRIQGVSGLASYAQIKETSFTLKNFQSSLYTKESCSDDYDEDNISNHLDLDSDADGCADGVEAGDSNVSDNDTTSYNTGTDANNNGLLDSFENGTTGTIDYDSSYHPYSLSTALNACADTDGDGIYDLFDIDDDNDGILDADESPNCFYSATEVNELNATGSELVWNTSYDYPKATDGD
ncbi:MAG: hypothetical protein DSZ08_07400, partial [Sulfurovum sp.]